MIRLALLLALLPPFPVAACDLALILASDVSNSMGSEQKAIVRKGTADALRHPEVVHALTSGETMVLALEFATSPVVVADWRPVGTSDDIADLAMAVETGVDLSRAGFGTEFANLLRFAAAAFERVPQCERLVLDIATDGHPEGIVPPSSGFLDPERHVVNVIFVAGEPSDLREMHERTRLGWAGFLLPIASFAEFPEAMRRKLLMEVS